MVNDLLGNLTVNSGNEYITVTSSSDFITVDTLGNLIPQSQLEPTYIKYSGRATIVFWNDGTKTIVKLMEGDLFDETYGFAMAYLKKVFGSNSKIKKMLKKVKAPKHSYKNAEKKLKEHYTNEEKKLLIKDIELIGFSKTHSSDLEKTDSVLAISNGDFSLAGIEAFGG